MTEAIDLSVDFADLGVPLVHFWNEVVGAGRAAEGLRADWRAQLTRAVRESGFRSVRFHGIFHDDMFVFREIDDVVVPSFGYVDEVFDALLEIGIRPFVELGFMPRELARETGTVFWWGGNGSPPKNLGKWCDLVKLTVQHWIERYGKDQVVTWNFEVWNEPNLAPFFRGTRTEYFELYAATVTTIKAIDERLQVGGPSTSNFVPDDRFAGDLEDATEHATVLEAVDLSALDWRPVWLAEFFEFCRRRSLPVDFVSVHPYPTDWALDEHGQGARLTRDRDATRIDLGTIRSMVDASPFPNARIHLTEWSSSSSSRDHAHDYLPAATFVIKSNLESLGLVDSLAYWTFTDIFEEQGGGQDPFHGGFGMLTQQNIAKPTFHAYRFLNRLGDQLIARAPGIVVTRHSASGRLTSIVYHYPDEVLQAPPASLDARDELRASPGRPLAPRAIAESTLRAGSSKNLRLRITGLPAGCEFGREILDSISGNVVAAWQSMDSPRNLSKSQLARLSEEQILAPQRVNRDASGDLVIDERLEPWTVLLIDQVAD